MDSPNYSSTSVSNKTTPYGINNGVEISFHHYITHSFGIGFYGEA